MQKCVEINTNFLCGQENVWKHGVFVQTDVFEM